MIRFIPGLPLFALIFVNFILVKRNWLLLLYVNTINLPIDLISSKVSKHYKRSIQPLVRFLNLVDCSVCAFSLWTLRNYFFPSLASCSAPACFSSFLVLCLLFWFIFLSYCIVCVLCTAFPGRRPGKLQKTVLQLFSPGMQGSLEVWESEQLLWCLDKNFCHKLTLNVRKAFCVYWAN